MSSAPNTPRSSNTSVAELDGGDSNSTPNRRPTRTVALIKPHALEHRMDIERRIEETGFEITKERQMEFTEESDQEYLHELFGDDTPALFEGPVWIYVLARRRAVSVFRTLMGPADPAVARTHAPSSLRALYGGSSPAQNAVGAARDEATAEEIITALFESSPPFEATETEDDAHIEGLSLDLTGDYEQVERAVGGYDDDDEYTSTNGIGNGNGTAHHQTFLSPTSSQTLSSTTGTTSAGSGIVKARTNSGTLPPNSTNRQFRARPLPKSTLAPPSAPPRTTRAAALRSGALVLAPTPFKDRHKELRKVAPTREETRQAFLDVPGHKRSSTIAVASTAPPAVAPRMTRAASLRINGGSPVVKRPAPAPRASLAPRDENIKIVDKERERAIFEGVPGHKRRESIAVASVKAPTVAPRLNKSAELRAKKEGAPPSSFMFRGASTPKAPLSRAFSQNNLANGAPAARPRSSMAGSAASTPSANAPAPAPTLSRSSSSLALAHPPRPPSIEPRQNRSAMLRAAKKAEDANGKPGSKQKHPPVSMKNLNSRARVA